MKTFVLTVSRTFPVTHKRKGERTYFPEKIMVTVNPNFEVKFIEEFGSILLKIHTIRANYTLWEKRIKQVQEGKAIISVRYWAGKPYHKDENGIGQVEICQLDKDSGIGIQELYFAYDSINFPRINEDKIKALMPVVLAKNDGLSIEDFKEWFKGYNLSEPMAIIHFTKFRY